MTGRLVRQARRAVASGELLPGLNLAAPLLRDAWARGKANALGAESDVCAPFAQYALDPVGFGRDVLGRRYWAGQRAILDNVIRHRFVTIRSTHKSGKTFALSDLALWAVCTAPTIVLYVMPVEEQLKNLAFANIRKAHASARTALPGSPGILSYRLGPKHFVVGIATNRAERVHGYHAEVDPPEDPDDDVGYLERARDEVLEVANELSQAGRLLIVIDEAPGVAQFIWDGLRGTLASSRVMVVLSGNPVQDPDADHFYAQSHQPGPSRWRRIKIAAYAAPDPLPADDVFEDGYGRDGRQGVPAWLMPEEWPAEQAAELGDDSPLFLGKVLGQFSAGDVSRKVVSSVLLTSALARIPTTTLGRHIGVDLAYQGGDRSVACLWDNGVRLAEWTWRLSDTSENVRRILTVLKSWAPPEGHPDYLPNPGILNPRNVHIDKGSTGGEVSRLHEMGYDVDGVDFGAGPAGDWGDLTGAVQFVNRRAELHWIYRRLFQEGMIRLERKWGNSWRQAQWPEYLSRDGSSSGTKLLIEPKKDIRKRHGASTDWLDADLLAQARTGGPSVRFAVY